MITIHWDFANGTEISYKQGLDKGDNFSTNCLDFFSNDTIADVIVLRKDGRMINSRYIHMHTDKEIRKSHNLHKMLVAGAFNWI